MRRRRFVNTAVILVFLMMIIGIPRPTYGNPSDSPTIIQPIIADGPLPDLPIVFVSRQRDETWRIYIGPPVDVTKRELSLGGNLMLWNPDGTVTNLTEGSGLYDVQQPDVSFDGSKIVFSAETEPDGNWFLWEIGVDGSGLHQLTFADRVIPIPPDPNRPGVNELIFKRYGDFGPIYLPDGRIMFTSTRFMTVAPSCGNQGQNLYVLNPGTGTKVRRTTERAGAIDPIVLNDGRIAFSHWNDAMHIPCAVGSGLQFRDSVFPSSWGIWVINPDGSGAHRYAFLQGGFEDGGGAHQQHELPNGDLVATFRGTRTGQFRHHTLDSAVTYITPGPVEPQELGFLGDPYNLEGPHALGPAPLPDGRIVLSYTINSFIETNWERLFRAYYDFGLYVANEDLETLTPIYNVPDCDELDAVIVCARSAPTIPDLPGADLITDDHNENMGQTALLVNHNVYAEIPLNITELPSPRVGTVAFLDVYDDTQQFSTSNDYPRIRRQPATFLERYPVDSNGAFSAEVPADKPLLFVLVNQDGVVVRSPLSKKGPSTSSGVVTHSFNGHDYLRPNTECHCTGCHLGHMFQPEVVAEAQANLSRLASATSSSEYHSFYASAWRVNDLRLAAENGSYSWVTDRGPGEWIQLDWPMPIQVEKVILHPVTVDNGHVISGTLSLSDQTSIVIGPLLDEDSPEVVTFDQSHDINWIRFTVDESDTNLVGLAELAVFGPPAGLILPDITPVSPSNLHFVDRNLLTWDRTEDGRDDPSIAGYRLYYGITSGQLNDFLDVGNYTYCRISEHLEPGITYFMAAKSYNVHGTGSNALSNEIEFTIVAPVITGVEPDHGPAYGNTPITITGENFSLDGVELRIGPEHDYPNCARDVQVVDEHTITAITPRADSGWSAVDVLVVNPDLQRAILPNGFSYDVWESLSAELTCLPAFGTLPFVTTITAMFTNHCAGQIRQFAGHIDLDLAGGVHYGHWRQGFANIAAGSNYSIGFNQSIPAVSSLIGANIFSLITEDVTPPPYNQQPYPPSGDFDMDTCTVVGVRP